MSLPRWHYRLSNLMRGVKLLEEAAGLASARQLSQLEREGFVQRFEYCWELAWKTLKDYLEFQGVTLEVITPKAVIRAGFEAKIIENGELWLEALDARNKMSHAYDEKHFEKISSEIVSRYGPLLYEFSAAMSQRLTT